MIHMCASRHLRRGLGGHVLPEKAGQEKEGRLKNAQVKIIVKRLPDGTLEGVIIRAEPTPSK